MLSHGVVLMSSPIAKTDKSFLDRLLIRAHKRLSHNRRVEILANSFSSQIKKLSQGIDSPIKILDVGCGDMSIAKRISQSQENAVITCADIYPRPDDQGEDSELWSRYIQLKGTAIETDEKFDFVLLSDVLHHIETQAEVIRLLQSCSKISRYVIVKDHFEYGPITRSILRAMDFLGNYGYGVSVPAKYFTKDSFDSTLESSGLRCLDMQIGLDLYSHLPLISKWLRNELHFMALLS